MGETKGGAGGHTARKERMKTIISEAAIIIITLYLMLTGLNFHYWNTGYYFVEYRGLRAEGCIIFTECKN